MPNADHPPAFQFYPQDFAADSKVEAMSTEAVGAYILLLCKAWREEPPGSLPDDDDVLARWSRMSLARWIELRATVLAPFMLGKDSRWHQKRMRREYSELVERRKVRTAAGAAGAAARWQTHGKRSNLPIARNEGEAEGEGNFLFGTELPENINTPEFRNAIAAWMAYKTERRDGYKPAGLKAMISRASKLAGEHGVQAVIDAMERAAANRWAGWDQPAAFPKSTKTRNGPGQTHNPDAAKGDPNYGRM